MDRSVFSRSDPEARNKFLAADAGRVPVVLSATHGVEGLAGSGPQVDLLRHPPRLPPDTAVLLVHAVNPHGFAWLRRTSEAILQAELATARSVAIVDLHTGLGPYGYGEPKWGLTEFGYEHAHGTCSHRLRRAGVRHRPAAARRDDLAQRRLVVAPRRSARPGGTELIRAALRDHFYPPLDDWKELVMFRTRQLFRQAPSGLAAER